MKITNRSGCVKLVKINTSPNSRIKNQNAELLSEMTKLQITGDTKKPKNVIIDHLLNLIDNRLKEIDRELEKLENDIEKYQKQYGMDNKEFQKRFAAGELDEDDEYYVWEGLIEVKRELINEKKALKELH